ncbi:MAG TPA: methyltransferase domain-containing protein, partial [Candidatus Kapabacteria bacterium]
SGVFSRLLAERGWNVTGIDLSEAMIQQARNYKSRMTNDEQQVQFQQSSFEAFESDKGPFDLILSLSMLEYVEDDEAAIEKCSRLLRPGGVLVVSVPNRAGLLRKLEGTIFGIRTATKGRVFGARGGYLEHQKRQYSPLELDILMRQMGLKKKRGIFLNAGIAGPRWLLPFLERRWWAAMYCGAYKMNQDEQDEKG